MHKLEGETQVFTSSIGYVPQQPWIQNKTLRDNVLFQKPYDESYYNKTIESCALREDLKVLTAGDMTEIGERVTNLKF
jgi:ATP-binding cassette, subfamily C (CFTR/MRP), member 1